MTGFINYTFAEDLFGEKAYKIKMKILFLIKSVKGKTHNGYINGYNSIPLEKTRNILNCKMFFTMWL